MNHAARGLIDNVHWNRGRLVGHLYLDSRVVSKLSVLNRLASGLLMSPTKGDLTDDHFPVDGEATPASQHDRVQDGPATLRHRRPVGDYPRFVSQSAAVRKRRSSSRGTSRVFGRHHLGAQERRPLARFTRAVSVSFNLPPATPRVDRVRRLGRSLAQAPASNGSAKAAALVRSDGRRDVLPRKKGGLDVGKTKRENAKVAS